MTTGWLHQHQMPHILSTMAYIKQPTTGLTTSNSQPLKYQLKQPDLLLYACLVEAFKFLKGPDNMLQLYEASYQEALQTFAAEQQGRRRRDEYRDGVVRIPIQSPTP